MNIDQRLKARLVATFGPLDTVAATKVLPRPGTLAGDLTKEEFKARKSANCRSITPGLASNFGTAAVEMWLRSVHSFLISTSLTEASPIWSSVSGYYASHYAVRGIAHLLGYFYLYSIQKMARLDFPKSGVRKCFFEKKPKGIGRGGEHLVYWVIVKDDPTFTADPLFTRNSQSSDESDAGHRNYANYIDHLSRFPNFQVLNEGIISDRIDQISKFTFTDPPIPRRSKFPDVAYVQLIAYHRIVAFRKLLDESLSHKNRFWSVYRNPPFASKYMTFQLPDSNGIGHSA